MQRTSHPSWLTAAIAAGLCLAAAGAAHRWLAARYLAPLGAVVLSEGTLAGLPMQIGDWYGQTGELQQQVIDAIGTDDHLGRLYVHAWGRGAVSVFVSAGTRWQALLPHRPEICYPSNGWAMADRRRSAIVLPDESAVPVTLYEFQRADLVGGRIGVLNCWLTESEWFADLNDFRWRLFAGRQRPSVLVQVHLSCSDSSADRSRDEILKDFAEVLLPQVRALIWSRLNAAGPTTEPVDSTVPGPSVAVGGVAE